uniref:Uncharacterized protein n=1 Tax=Guillardia theta TaxID=55529 RepID=A0A7S4UCE9_GUITH
MSGNFQLFLAFLLCFPGADCLQTRSVEHRSNSWDVVLTANNTWRAPGRRELLSYSSEKSPTQDGREAESVEEHAEISWRDSLKVGQIRRNFVERFASIAAIPIGFFTFGLGVVITPLGLATTAAVGLYAVIKYERPYKFIHSLRNTTEVSPCQKEDDVALGDNNSNVVVFRVPVPPPSIQSRTPAKPRSLWKTCFLPCFCGLRGST